MEDKLKVAAITTLLENEAKEGFASIQTQLGKIFTNVGRRDVWPKDFFAVNTSIQWPTYIANFLLISRSSVGESDFYPTHSACRDHSVVRRTTRTAPSGPSMAASPASSGERPAAGDETQAPFISPVWLLEQDALKYFICNTGAAFGPGDLHVLSSLVIQLIVVVSCSLIASLGRRRT